MRWLRCGPLGAVLPAYYVAVVAGVISLRRDASVTFRRSTLGFLWCLVHLAATIYASVSVFNKLHWRLTKGSCTIDNNCVASAVISVQLASELAGVAGALLRRRATIKCLNMAGEVLEKAYPKGHTLPLEAFVPVGFMVLVLGRIALLVFWVHRIKLSEAAMLVLYITPIAVEGLFGALCLAVQMGLASINAGLEELYMLHCAKTWLTAVNGDLESIHGRQFEAEWMAELNNSVDDTREAEIKTATRLQQLRRQHEAVCDLVGVIASRFGFDILVAVPVSFLQVVLLLYFGVVSISPSSQNFPKWYFVSTGTHFAITVARVCYNCYRCEAVLSKSERTGILLQKLNQRSMDSDTKEEIRFFSMQLNCRNINFTACGFFPIDFTLLYSIVGAVTTYLVILMQFKPPVKISDDDVLSTTPADLDGTT